MRWWQIHQSVNQLKIQKPVQPSIQKCLNQNTFWNGIENAQNTKKKKKKKKTERQIITYIHNRDNNHYEVTHTNQIKSNQIKSKSKSKSNSKFKL